MQLTFLGTSSMMPTKERNPLATLLDFKGEGILFDCGEGTQRQFKIAGKSIARIRRICISHWHGDHVLGLPGLLQTYAAAQTGNELDIYGPKGTLRHYKAMMDGIEFEERLKVNVYEVGEGVFFENSKYKLEALPLKHPVPCVGYAFTEKDRRRIKPEFVKKLGECPLLGELQRGKSVDFKGKKITPAVATVKVKGKKIVVITDTRWTKNCVGLAEDADVLVIEGTFANKLKDKAEEYAHLTSLEAAQIASQAGVKKLILTHFSARYKDTEEILEDARTAFDNVVCAYDFMKVKL
jgi:ribonuclease Z